MAPNKPSRNPAGATGVTSVKMLVTASSLAAVVGGWAALTLLGPKAEAKVAEEIDDQGEMELELPPLPTLVPEVSAVAPARIPVSMTLAGLPVTNPIGVLPPQITPGVTNAPPPKPGSDKEGVDKSNKPEKPAKPDKPEPVANTKAS